MPHQAGSHDQHVKAGEQSHKGAGTKQAGKPDDKAGSSASRASDKGASSKPSDSRKGH